MISSTAVSVDKHSHEKMKQGSVQSRLKSRLKERWFQVGYLHMDIKHRGKKMKSCSSKLQAIMCGLNKDI